MRNHRTLISLIILCSFLFLSACNDENEENIQSFSDGVSKSSFQLATASSVSNDAMAESDSGAEATIVDRSKLGDRKVAENHSFKIELQADQLQARMMTDYQTCLSLGCEIMNSQVRSKRSATLSAHVPPDKLAAFFKAIESGSGEVKEHQVSVYDETNNYVDTAARLKNQMALRDRLSALLQKESVKSVRDVLEIEREMTRVQQQIDSATGQMKALETRTSMATVNVSYDVPYFARQDHYERLKTSFSRAWRGLVQSLDEVIVFVGTALPWIPVILFGFWVAIRVIRASFSGGFKLFKKKNKDLAQG